MHVTIIYTIHQKSLGQLHEWEGKGGKWGTQRRDEKYVGITLLGTELWGVTLESPVR
jgi:hypothetical protein